MATMFPAMIPDAPEPDQLVFGLLRDDPVTDGWVVIHDVKNPASDPPQRGIDFLALVPGTAILCVEVKSGGFEIRQGQWYAPGSRERIDPPGKQAEKAMYGLDDRLRSRFASWQSDADLPMDCVVLFTDTRWPPHLRPLAYPTVDLPDQGDKSLGECLAEIAREIHEDIPDGITLDSQTIQTIQDYLAGNLD